MLQGNVAAPRQAFSLLSRESTVGPFGDGERRAPYLALLQMVRLVGATHVVTRSAPALGFKQYSVPRVSYYYRCLAVGSFATLQGKVGNMGPQPLA